ncbi:mechanosensitive ion channel family protein [Ereboglobus luteus]|nr:mechanosensitive ion channel family protein [Ereboglobus luteus]
MKKRHLSRFRLAVPALLLSFGLLFAGVVVFGQSRSVPEPEPPPSATTAAQQAASGNDAAAAAVAGGYVDTELPEFIRETADTILAFFDVQKTGNSWQRLVLAAAIIVAFYLMRRLLLPAVFFLLKKLAGRTTWTFDDRVVDAAEPPSALFLMLSGIYVAVLTLDYAPPVSKAIGSTATLLFSVTFFWLLLRLLNAGLDYMHTKAAQRGAGIALYMPWIRKTLVGIFAVASVLTIAQNVFGLEIQAFIAGLGIGGLALALAAQDTVANVFGAAVVAVDQPFKIGESVQLAGHSGTVEDIGIRSMKLRRPDKALVIIPNKTVASESIVNLSKFTNRRVEQVLGFTYDSTPDQMAAIVDDIRALIKAESDVLPNSEMVYFRDFSASSLDMWIVYVTREPDFAKQMALRQRLNLAFMRAAAARGLSFAFPTQTIDLAPSAMKALGKNQ